MWHSNMTFQEYHRACIEQRKRDLCHAKMMRDQWQRNIEKLEADLAALAKLEPTS